ESRARTLDREFAEAGMIQRYEMAAMRELSITVRIGAVLHLMGGNAKRLKAGFNHTAIECAGPGSYARIDGVAMLEPSSGKRIARVAGKVFIFNCGAKAAPVVIAAADDRDPLVIAGGWINAMGREDGVGISDPSVDAAVRRVVENRRREKMNRAFSLRLIDILTLAGAPPMVERRKNRNRRVTWRHVVRVRAEDPGGSAVRPSGEIVKSRNRGRHIAEAGDFRERSGLSHQARAEHYEVRVDLAQRLVFEPPSAHRLGREGLGDDVGPSHEIVHDRARGAIPEIERDSQFAGVAIGEHARAVGAELVVQIRLERARGIDSGGRLDSHDGRAIVGKNPGRGG